MRSRGYAYGSFYVKGMRVIFFFYYFPRAIVKKNITCIAEDARTVRFSIKGEPGVKVWYNKMHITFLRG